MKKIYLHKIGETVKFDKCYVCGRVCVWWGGGGESKVKRMNRDAVYRKNDFQYEAG